ncbi:MAG: universal stress protein [Cyanophyceae cyanobacterium]
MVFERPLICTDFGDGLDRLARMVPSFLSGGIQELVFLSVVPYRLERDIPREDTDAIAAAQQRLGRALQGAPHGPVTVAVRSGRPEDVILAVAEEFRCDAVVVGGASHSLLEEKLFGGTAIALGQRGTVPLLILRPQLLAALTLEELDLRCRHLVRQVLMPHNGGPSAERATARLLALIQRQRDRGLPVAVERCWLYQAVEEIRDLPMESVLAEHRDRLGRVRDQFAALGVAAEVLVEPGSFLPGLMAVAQEYDVSAIVIASRHRNFFLDWSMPNSGQRVLRRSLHPVLFFPSRA